MSAIDLDADGEMVRDRQGFTRVEGLDQIVQDILWSTLGRGGEIPRDRTLFIPWIQLLEQAVEPQIVAQHVQEHILARAGVTTCTAEATLESSTRTALVTYRATISLDDLRQTVHLDESIVVPL